MSRRFVSIWFRYLATDWFTIRHPQLKECPFVLTRPDHGRMVISSVNEKAESLGIFTGMVLADARAIFPSLEFKDDIPDLQCQLLKRIAERFIRYSPFISLDSSDGLFIDATGCAHLWGGEESYLKDMIRRLEERGYHVHIAMADTIGAAWALAHYSKKRIVIENGFQCLLSLPPVSLRIEGSIAEQLYTLGLSRIHQLVKIPKQALRRRFGTTILKRINQAMGTEEEIIEPVHPVVQYQERLPCMEPISTAIGIHIALERSLQHLCDRLAAEEKGLRRAIFKCFRIDNKIESIEIGTHLPSHNRAHLFRLFENKIGTIEPADGIDLFILEASLVQPVIHLQEKIWQKADGLRNIYLSELLDRVQGKLGAGKIHRFLPDEHYWPERSVRSTISLEEQTISSWKVDRPRPLYLLSEPEKIDVTAPVPDYPPMNFRYKGQLHIISRADGPERIEQEWWIQAGQHRDYYYVEDVEGRRYWLFRLGHYSDKNYQWYLHGFFV